MTPLPDHRDFQQVPGWLPGSEPNTTMHLDTNRIYLCTDATNAAVHLLLPKTLNFEVIELRLDNPDPSSTEAAGPHFAGTVTTVWSTAP